MSIFPENVRLKPIALPTEHGAWGFLLEPLLLGLAVVPSWTGLIVVVGTLAGFLFRQPIRIVWSDFSAGRNTSRTHAALVFGGVYFVAASVFLAAAISENVLIAIPLIVAAPAGLVVLVLDARRKSRSLVVELLGPSALGSTGAAVAIAGGFSLTMGFVIWGLVIARAVPTILYVRARLRLEYGEEPSLVPPVGSHVGAIAGSSALAFVGLIPHVVSLVYLVLLVRACMGLSLLRRSLAARMVGFVEMGWGLFTIVALAVLLRL